MTEGSGANLLVYREGRQRLSGGELVRQLRSYLSDLNPNPSQDALVTALLRAGELECALCDAGLREAAVAADITDRLAAQACSLIHTASGDTELLKAADTLDAVGSERELTVSRPEGFAYYALHPLDFADLATQLPLRTNFACVLGIRSIGTTLSAVVAAQLMRMGARVQRSTIRPTGHAYQRRCCFNPIQQEAINLALRDGADFLVCDEGPGRSGSSFLSVAEALEACNVPRDRITLLCSHDPDVGSLCAPDAQQRWPRYKSLASGMTSRLPCEAGEYLGGGEWRRVLIPSDHEWPPTWPQMERLKYLGREGHSIWKFQGHGHYGESVHRREQLLADSGFGVPYTGRETGFGAHELIAGSAAISEDVNFSLVRQLSEYCAWRGRSMAAVVSHHEQAELAAMVAGNLESEFGWSPELRLDVVSPAICDNRMQPAKWRLSATDRWVKLDGAAHGDDHFFPGPTDIAWDLAGVTIEWSLGPDTRAHFLAEYQRISGDNPTTRIADYELAYATFRMAWSKMAAGSTQGTAEAPRLWREYLRYKAAVEKVLEARRQTVALAA